MNTWLAIGIVVVIVGGLALALRDGKRWTELAAAGSMHPEQLSRVVRTLSDHRIPYRLHRGSLAMTAGMNSAGTSTTVLVPKDEEPRARTLVGDIINSS